MNDAIQAFAKVEQMLEGLSASSVANISREMDLIGDMLVSSIREDKLSGQVLKERSGRLKHGVYHSAPQASTDLVTMAVGVQNIPYAAAHEFGATVSIPEYFGKIMKFRAASGDLVFTRHRRAYTVMLPERSYVRTTIDEKSREIHDRLEAAVLRGRK